MSSSTQAAAQDNNEELAKMRAAYNQMAKEIQVLAFDREWLEETYAQETEKVEVKSERLRLALLDLKRDAYDMFAQITEKRANIDSESCCCVRRWTRWSQKHSSLARSHDSGRSRLLLKIRRRAERNLLPHHQTQRPPLHRNKACVIRSLITTSLRVLPECTSPILN